MFIDNQKKEWDSLLDTVRETFEGVTKVIADFLRGDFKQAKLDTYTLLHDKLGFPSDQEIIQWFWDDGILKALDELKILVVDPIKNVGAKIKEGFERIISDSHLVNWDKMFDGIRDAFDRVVKWWNTYVTPVFQSLWASIRNIFSGGSTAVTSVSKTVTTHTSSSSRVHGGFSGSFAEGGTPTVGSLFWAGEAGPELVGSIGGRTTVTNTDQFGKAMNDQTNMLLGALNLLNKTVQEKDFDITLDGMSLARGMSPYSAKYAKIQGASLINGVT